MTETAITFHSLKNSARRAKSASKTINSLINRISCQWQRVDAGKVGLADLIKVLAVVLAGKPSADSQKADSQSLSEREKLFFSCLDEDLQEALRLGCRAYVGVERDLLIAQGLTFAREQTLSAFFLSKIYEALRYGPDSSEPLRGRRGRQGGAHFSPPSLAYLAAKEAFDGQVMTADDLPLTVDPACGTGLFLLAALDYLGDCFPICTAAQIARQCLGGAEMDAVTLAVAKICLHLAARDGQCSAGLVWADGLVHDFQNVVVVLSNPPWHRLKEAGQLSRVNKARAAKRRQKFFSHGQSDTNLYKLFVERSLQITAGGARIIMLLPASFLSDSSAALLRGRLQEESSLTRIYGFTNTDAAFNIHEQFKYALLNYQKGTSDNYTDAVFGLVAGRSRLVDNSCQLRLSADDLSLLGGGESRVPELVNAEALLLHRRVCRDTATFGDFIKQSGGMIFFRREFDMTLDRPKMIEAVNLKRSEITHLPLLQGAMIGQYRVRPEGRFYVEKLDYLARCPERHFKIGFQSISSSLNSRSMVAAALPDLPVGNSLTTIVFSQPEGARVGLYTLAIFNSFVFDYFLRTRLSGTTITYQLLASLPFALAHKPWHDYIAGLSEDLTKYGDATTGGADAGAVLILRKRILLEYLIAKIYKISLAEMRHILRDCHYPAPTLALRRRLDADLPDNLPDLSSFFRVDKGLAPEQRLTSLLLEAFEYYEKIEKNGGRIDFVEPLPLSPAFEANLHSRFATLSSSQAVGAI